MLRAYTRFHVLISLIAIFTGLVVLAGWISSKSLAGWTEVFFWTTVATSVTGFFFPYTGFKPSYVVGALSLVLLVFTYLGLYSHQLVGGWRVVYLVTATLALYLNCFVLVVQSFQKVPALNRMTPTQSEPPFKRSQAALLLTFLFLGFLAVRNFR